MIRQSFAILCCIFALPAAAVTADAGTIKSVRGQVTVERAGKSVEVQVGDPVFEGDRVRVRGDGSVGISLRDETLISLGPNSNLVIDAYAYNPTTREGAVETSILKGTLRYVTGLIGRLNPAAIKVKTPTATVGIRGTDFIVEVPDEEK
jgi:hypothetical protein